MGQKVNPNGLRLGINKDWEAKWYSNKADFSKYEEYILGEDRYRSLKKLNKNGDKLLSKIINHFQK